MNSLEVLQDLDMNQVLANIDRLTPAEQREFLDVVTQLQEIESRQACARDFLSFVKRLWPEFIEGTHFTTIGSIFNDVADGKEKRVTLSIAPRHGKSKLASTYLPAWFIGRYPDKKVIIASHTAELATGFGRDVRNLVATPEYQKIFPGVALRADSKAAGRWSTNKGGEFFAAGVGGAITGKGADLLIIDDAIDEQTATMGVVQPEIFDKTYEWYSSGPRQRLQPGARIVIIGTRWHKRDLIGRVIETSIEREGTDEWHVIEFPAVLEADPIRNLPERPLWPQFWPMEELMKLKAELPASKWNAQYMQAPSAEDSTILKRAWWREWTKAEPPPVKMIIMTCDTAYSAKTRADFSAVTIFGVFEYVEEDPASKFKGKTLDHIILLEAWAERYEFPDLKEAIRRDITYWKPDACIIEAKAAGAPLVQELRASGIYVSDFTPARGSRSNPNDKIARTNAVADILASGVVWVPQTRFAEEVVDQCSEFPFGRNDDLCDCVVMALARFRQGGFVRLETDDEGDPFNFGLPMSQEPFY